MRDQKSTQPDEHIVGMVPGHEIPVYESRVGGWWYYVVTILSGGFLAWVPFLHAAVRLRTTYASVLAALFGALNALMYVLLLTVPEDNAGNTVASRMTTAFGLVTVVTLIGGCLLLTAVQRRFYVLPQVVPPPASAPPHPAAPRQPVTDPAIAAVLDARKRREESRKLVEDDALMARELRVGRPDLDRDYDDGGLVDLNAAPAETIADTCGIPLHSAQLIVLARDDRPESFFSVDELLISAEVPVSQWDRVRDRGVLVP